MYIWPMAVHNLYHPQFFTATILQWKLILKEDVYKQIIISSLDYLVNDKRIAVYGFVIMPNHIHLIWQMCGDHKRENVQRDFLKYTAQRIKQKMQNHNPTLLSQLLVNAKDRKYQIWERNPLSIDLFSNEILQQKLNYIHENPIKEKWKLAEFPEHYIYSSAAFYYTGRKDWSFLRHFLG
jgi:Transposase and inactivated derivatives